eukprot:XP_003730695.1 PREDICTED: ladderlectin-like [Strongylocentrotus purpuratus]
MSSFTDVVLFYFTIPVCPVGWVYGHTKCFLIVNPPTNVDWKTTRDYCNGLEAVTTGNGETVEPSLLFIENVEEYDLLKPHVSEPRFWINCNFIKTWMCYTDRAGTTSDYRNWRPTRPVTGNKCVVMWTSNGQMNDRSCSNADPTTTVCQAKL